MSHTMTRTWLITGCSTGFGKILAQAALDRGDNVVATARNTETLADLRPAAPGKLAIAPLDVTRPGDAAAAVALAEKSFGRLDILVNNAGYGFVGAVEEATPDEYRPMFETNVFGLIETTRAALPALRRSRGGRIVNLSSIAGIVGRAGFGYYNASKFAVEGLSEALAQEMEPFGVKVIIVEPGPFRTEFLGRSINAASNEMPTYAETSGVTRRYAAQGDGLQGGDPHKAIAVILKAIDADTPPLHLVLGEEAYPRARAKLKAFVADLDAWEPLGGAATRFD